STDFRALSGLMLTPEVATNNGLASYPKSNIDTCRVAFAMRLDPISNTIESAISAVTSRRKREPARPGVVPELSFTGSLGAIRLAYHAGRLAASATATIIATNDSMNTRHLHCDSIATPSA